MNVRLVNQIKKELQKEHLRRALRKYFIEKGYEESFDTPLYPAICADLPACIKHLFNRVEVVPYVLESDPITGVVKLGWNLFVLGTHRIDLGSTSHTHMAELEMAVRGQVNRDMPADRIATPSRVIDFIIRNLENSKTGFVELPANFQLPSEVLNNPLNSSSYNGRTGSAGPSRSGQFYSK